jgi:1,4-dihydroxy-2-naphthoate polyprenyltransferase
MIYLMGYLLALIAGFDLDLTKFAFGYLIFGAAQLSVSFSNDYFDRHSDKNSIKTSFSGGSKILVEHPDLEFFAVTFAVFLLVFSFITSLIFTVVYGYTLWFIVFSLLGGLLGWFYSAPPVKFAYRGLGELATVLAVGFFMPGMGYFVASGTIGSLFSLFVLPLSCYGLFFIISVELPDVESDRLGEKTNFLVKYGRTTGKIVCLLVTAIGTTSMLVMLLSGTAKSFIDWSPLLGLSVIPLMVAFAGFLSDTTFRKNLVRQVMMNMASMIGFIFLIDVTLIFQYV